MRLKEVDEKNRNAIFRTQVADLMTDSVATSFVSVLSLSNKNYVPPKQLKVKRFQVLHSSESGLADYKAN